MNLLHTLLTHHPHWKIVTEALDQKTTAGQTACHTQQCIQQQYSAILYQNSIGDEYKLDAITNFFYELMSMADLLIENQQHQHALGIITTSFSYVHEIDAHTLSDWEVVFLIEQFGLSLQKLLQQSPSQQTPQLIDSYKQFLATIDPDNIYLKMLKELI